MFSMAKEMTIGIMPRKDFQAYTKAIARGEKKLTGKEPKVWFDSVESMAQVLSTKNRELLRIIQEQKPESLTELAAESGRRLANLSRTLKNMERYGIVELDKEGGSVKPRVRVSKFHAVFSL